MRLADLICGLLYDAGTEGVTLRELQVAAGLDAEALSRRLGHLRQRGHRIETTADGRAQLVGPLRLDAYLIERGLDTHRVGRNAICFESVGSTNDVAWDALRGGGADGLVVAAEAQTRGRGRQGRRWTSPPGANLLFSVVLEDPAAAIPNEALTIAAGVAVAEGVEAFLGGECTLKWPNDVLLDGAKLAGVLVESRGRRIDRACVVGIGINVAAAPPPEEVARPATCLADHAEGPADRIAVLRGVLRHLDDWLVRIAAGDAERLRQSWLSRCAMLGESVRVRCEGRIYRGRVLDIDPLEGLVLIPDQGPRMHLAGQNASILD